MIAIYHLLDAPTGSKGFNSTMPTPLNSSGGNGSTTATSVANSSRARTVDDIHSNAGSLRSAASESSLHAGYTAKYNAKGSELKRIWQSVLRECHRSDPDRVGQVSRNVFIAALEKSDLDKVSALLVYCIVLL